MNDKYNPSVTASEDYEDIYADKKKLPKNTLIHNCLVNCAVGISSLLIGAVVMFLWIWGEIKKTDQKSPIQPMRTIDNPYTEMEAIDFTVERLHEEYIRAPETMIIGPNNMIYSALSDGSVVRFNEKKHEVLFTLGTVFDRSICGISDNENVCGRGLGLIFHPVTGDLYIADAYYGIYVAKKSTDYQDKDLVSDNCAGRKLGLVNSLAFDNDNNLWFTVSSFEYNRNQVMYETVSNNPRAHLCKISAEQILNNFRPDYPIFAAISGIQFLNGLTLSHDKKSLLLISTTTGMIYSYSLEPSTYGKIKQFTTGAPCYMDNIHPLYLTYTNTNEVGSSTKNLNNRGANGYIVGCAAGRTKFDNNNWTLEEYPSLRKWSASRRSYREFHDLVLSSTDTRGSFIHVDNNGNILQFFKSIDWTIKQSSDVIPYVTNDNRFVLFVGSWSTRQTLVYVNDSLEIANALKINTENFE